MVVVAAGRRLTEPQKRAVMLAFWVKRTVEAAATSKKCSFSGLGGWWINQLDVEYNFKIKRYLHREMARRPISPFLVFVVPCCPLPAVGLCGCAGQVGDGDVSVEAVMWQLMEVLGILAGRGKRDLETFRGCHFRHLRNSYNLLYLL